MRQEMFAAAENLEFEKAARMRDELRKLQAEARACRCAARVRARGRGRWRSLAGAADAAARRPRAGAQAGDYGASRPGLGQRQGRQRHRQQPRATPGERPRDIRRRISQARQPGAEAAMTRAEDEGSADLGGARQTRLEQSVASAGRHAGHIASSNARSGRTPSQSTVVRLAALRGQPGQPGQALGDAEQGRARQRRRARTGSRPERRGEQQRRHDEAEADGQRPALPAHERGLQHEPDSAVGSSRPDQ